jgi:hypothetical protein
VPPGFIAKLKLLLAAGQGGAAGGAGAKKIDVHFVKRLLAVAVQASGAEEVLQIPRSVHIALKDRNWKRAGKLGARNLGLASDPSNFILFASLASQLIIICTKSLQSYFQRCVVTRDLCIVALLLFNEPQ